MSQLTQAQRVLLLCGVDSARLHLHLFSQKSRSNTKKGPGRVHRNGKEKSE